MKQLYPFFVLAFTFSLVTGRANAQKESAIWYFGDLAGLDFNVQPPRSISNPNMKTFEGCSSVSDTSGSLLFYSDGRTVWNKQHAIMENGTNLLGDASSTHSSTIVKKPFSAGEYYIITADAWPDLSGDPNSGVNYSIVNMSDNNGNGKITLKNSKLVQASAEKIAITRHRNGAYAWLAIPECFTANLHLFLITENGIELKTTYSNFFPVMQSGWGQIKFSPDGRHLGLTWPLPNGQSSDVMILDFNNATGLLNPAQVISGGDKLYGLEFSPESKYIYLSTWIDKNKVCQCEVKQGTTNYATDCKFYNQRNVSGQLQLGPDSKIYIANSFRPYLGAIQYPDSPFAKSGFIDSAIALLPGTQSYSGLPTIYTGYLFAENITIQDICLGDTGYFSVSKKHLVYDSIHWFVNTTQLPDTSALASYYFTRPGLYEISAVLFSNINADTFTKSMVVKPLPVDPLLRDTFLCDKQPAVFDAYRQQNIRYLWNTGSTDSVITTSAAGNYSVTLKLDGCSLTSSFNLYDKPYPQVNIPDETVICEGTIAQFSAFLPGAGYLWSTSDTSSSISITEDQAYWVAVTLDGCTTTDTFTVHTTTYPEIDLGVDTSICQSQQLRLNAFHLFSTYSWSDLSTLPALTISTPGLYAVSVKNPCGINSDTIQVSEAVCNCLVWTPNIFTPNGDFTNDLFIPVISCEYLSFDLRIYNRWGLEIFRSFSPEDAWNGRFKDEPMPAGVYTWQLTCELVNSRGAIISQNVNGTVTLLR